MRVFRPGLWWVFPATAALGLSFWIGKSYGERISRPPMPLSATSIHLDQGSAAADGHLQSRANRTSGPEIAVIRPRSTDGPPPSQAADWRSLIDLGANRRQGLSITLLQANGHLTAAAAKLFDLGPSDVAGVEQCLALAQSSLRELAERNTTSRTDPDGTIEMTVTAFPAQGASIYDQLTTELSHTLGAEKASALIGTVGEEIEQHFDSFGSEERSIQLKHVDQDNGAAYMIVDKQLLGNGAVRETSFAVPTIEDAATRLGLPTSAFAPTTGG